MGYLSAAWADQWQLHRARRARRHLYWARPTYAQPVKRWLVLQSGPNPSTDYYIRPRATASNLPTVYRNLHSDAPSASDLVDGTLVVVVRYLNHRWAEALHARTQSLAGVVYFMDDDLLDPAAWVGLPPPYQEKLARHFATAARDIASLASEVWVSTPTLQSRYAELGAQVTPPVRLVDDLPRTGLVDSVVRVIYHGTKAHQAEIHWLRPVVASILEACPQVHFEIIGDDEVNKLYRELPRTHVLHPMSWPNYLAYCRALWSHIALAPLLDSAFNAGRSHTKVFDVARCGAVGIFTEAAPYDGVIRNGINGLLLPNDPEAWVRRITELVDDRERLAQLSRDSCAHFGNCTPCPADVSAPTFKQQR